MSGLRLFFTLSGLQRNSHRETLTCNTIEGICPMISEIFYVPYWMYRQARRWEE